MATLPTRIQAQASAITTTTLIHIVVTGDTSQSPQGSSYKATLGQLTSLFGGNTDLYITGGTYSSGTLTLTNLTGGTITIGGFYTDQDDVYVTGSTLTVADNNTNTQSSELIYHGTPIGGPYFIDTENTFITGGTYDNNTTLITFTKNDGSAFTVDLSSIDVNDTYVTGGTNNQATDNTNLASIDLLYNQDVLPGTYNLPYNNTFLTGGTYDNNTTLITFTKNDGTNFTVDLSSIDVNDTFVTGFTYDNINTFTVSRNDGVNLGSTISILSGITYYGDGVGLINIPISGVTNLQGVLNTKISGATNLSSEGLFAQINGFDLEFKGLTSTGSTLNITSDGNTVNLETILPQDVFVYSGNANVSNSTLTFLNTTGGTFTVTNSAALFADNDINVTGGTYNPTTGCVTFTTNSGTTFDVCGFLTGFTDTFVTGGTYSAGTAVFTNNLGGTFNVTGFTQPFTGNTSGDCITDLYVSNIHSCSPLNINPLDEGNVYFGSTSGVTVDLTNVRVGIGSTVPTSKLHITNTSADNSFLVEDSANPDSTPFVIDNNGNVGIGVTGTTYKLDVNGTTIHRDSVQMVNTKEIFWSNTDGIWPTSLANRIRWTLNNDSAQIYAYQPFSDDIDFVFKITDNANTSTDNYVFWIDDNAGEQTDSYPLEMNGLQFIVNPLRRYATVPANSGAGNTDFYILKQSATTLSESLMFADVSTTRIGINTSSPSETLDINGKTKTINFQMTSGATNGYVLTSDASGNASWQVSSGGGTFTGGTVTGETIFTGGLSATTISATTIGSPTDCVNDLYVSNIHSCSPLNINPLDEGNVYFGSTSGVTIDLTNVRVGIGTKTPQYPLDVLGTNSNLFYDPASVGGIIAISGNTGVPRLGVAVAASGTRVSTGGQWGMRAWDDLSFPGYGNVGDMFVYAGNETYGLNFINPVGANQGTRPTEDYIRFYAGQTATGTADIHIQGSGSTRGFVGINNITPTERLDVVGKTKTTNLQMTSGATNGYVLTSDASGNASWQSGATVNIYNSDGSLTSDRTLNFTGFRNIFSGTNSNQIVSLDVSAKSGSGNRYIRLQNKDTLFNSTNEVFISSGGAGLYYSDSLVTSGQISVDASQTYINRTAGFANNTIFIDTAIHLNYQDAFTTTELIIQDNGFNFNGAYVLPKIDGTSGQVLTTDGSGGVTWQTSSGGVSIDPYNNLGNVNTITWDVSGNSTNYQATLTGNTTLALTNVRNGEYGTIIVQQDGVGGRTLTFGNINGSAGTHRVANGGGGVPVLTSNPGAIDILTFTYNGSVMFWTVGNDYT